uniref:Uncharacterized protein n=1 Tax=Schistocephalus solidus TaxID=70667 RepID=A0A0X3PE83_SCHSO
MSAQMSLQNSVSESHEGKRRCCGLMRRKKASSFQMEVGEDFGEWADRATQYQAGADVTPAGLEDLRHTIRTIAEEVHEQSQDLTALLQKTLLSGRNGSLASRGKSVLAEEATVKEGGRGAVTALTDAEVSKKAIRMSLPEALDAIQHSVESFARGGEDGHAELTFTLDQFPTGRPKELNSWQMGSDTKSALGVISSSMLREAEFDHAPDRGSKKTSAAAAAINLPSPKSVSEMPKMYDNLPEALEAMRESIELLAQVVHRDNAELTRLIRTSMSSFNPACADPVLPVGRNSLLTPATGDLHEIQLGLQELDEEIHRQNREMKSILLQAMDVSPEMIAMEIREEVPQSRGGFFSGGSMLRKENHPFASSSQQRQKKVSRADESSIIEFKHSGKAREDLFMEDIGERTSIASLPPLTMEPLKKLRASVRQLEADLKADKRGPDLVRTIDAIKANAESIRNELEALQPPPPTPLAKRSPTGQQELSASDPLVQAVLEMVRQAVKARTTTRDVGGTNAEAMKVLAEIRRCIQSSQGGFPATTNNGVDSNLGGYEGIRLIVQMVKDARIQGL